MIIIIIITTRLSDCAEGAAGAGWMLFGRWWAEGLGLESVQLPVRCGTPQGRCRLLLVESHTVSAGLKLISRPTPKYTKHDAAADLCVDPIIVLRCGLFSWFSDYRHTTSILMSLNQTSVKNNIFFFLRLSLNNCVRIVAFNVLCDRHRLDMNRHFCLINAKYFFFSTGGPSVIKQAMTQLNKSFWAAKSCSFLSFPLFAFLLISTPTQHWKGVK